VKRTTQNILAMFASDGVVRLLGFVTTAFMAHVLEPAAFGTISFASAVMSYGVLFSSPGLHIIGALKIADKSVSPASLVRTITWLRVLLALIFCVAAGMVYFFGVSTPLAATAFFYSCVLLPVAFQLEWFFQGRETLTVTGIGKIAASLIFVVSIVLALTPGNYHWFVPLCYGSGMAVQAIILWLSYRRVKQSVPASDPVAAREPLSRYSWRTLIPHALPVGAAVIAAQALLNFPSIAIGLFSTTAEVARFSAAAKLVFFVLAIDRVMYSIFFPFVARMHATSPLSLPSYLERFAKYIFLICVPICMGGSVLAPRILALIFGAPYASAANLLQIQLWYFFFTILNSLFSYPLIAIGQVRYYGTATTVISIVTIVLLLPLIYFFSSVGASVGLVLGELVLVVSMALKAGPLFPRSSYAHIIKPLVSSVAMGCFLVIFSYISLFLLIPAAALVYLFAVISVKAFDSNDLLFLKERLV
jgi:O-antigen/teichoic acid export membrane protein